MLKEYKLSVYHDYGPLENKEQVRLIRNKITGKVCVKKILNREQQDIIKFRVENNSLYFPQIIEVIEDKEQLILVEEYIEGVNLEDYLMGTALDEETAAEIAVQICEALQLLHHACPMIIYRDLKAENVMITSERKVKLIDFDISREYQKGKKRDTRLLGTAEYAAPEQFGYFQTDNRTDIYAFGVLFNYMLTGKFPIEYITEGTYTEVIRKCIELEPGKRYQSVEEILQVLTPNRTQEAKIETEDNKTKEEISWKFPGFRSGKPWKILCAILGYGLIFYIGFSIEFTDGNGTLYPLRKLWVNRICFTLAQIITILFNFDYRGVLKSIPMLQECPKILRLVIFIISWFMFLIMAVIVAIIIETIMHF